MTMQAVAIEDASKRFGKTIALDGVDFSMAKGERVALLGPNGAGKTTLIRAIVGRCRLDAGRVSLFGEPAGAHNRKRIGFVPQELAIHGSLSAEENLHFFGRLQGVKHAVLNERIEKALEWTGLESRSHDLAMTFSGGMKRRLNIACGVLHEPDLVLLDEPTVGVDPQSRERIHEMLVALHARGTSLLLTTHMMEEAERGADRVVIQDHGKTIANGSSEQLVVDAFGSQRTLKLVLEEDPGDRLAEPWVVDGRYASREIERVEDVSTILQECARSGITVSGLQVEAPSLQEVFLKMTGRELRE